MIRVVFIWLVILMSAFIVQIINSQKAEIMRARENLIRSENMAVLGQLAAGVAHEINNPIGIISAYAEFLKKNAEPGDRRAEDFEAIHKEALRCRNIVEELLDYARPSADNRGQIDARGIADGVIDFLFRREAPETLRIEKDYAGHLPGVTADAGQIKQALLNVLMNARQALPAEGGTIRVSIRPDTDRGVVTIRIDDTGCGIEPDDTAKVFNPFFTRRHGGTGLGLSITKRIIEDHRGTVVLTSRRGKGTSVEIALPFDPEDPAARRGSSAFLPRIR
jgi:signal transduction histidine kinase